jgi:hypothetical protein
MLLFRPQLIRDLDVLSPYPGIIECIPIFNNAKYSSPAVAIVFLEQIGAWRYLSGSAGMI